MVSKAGIGCFLIVLYPFFKNCLSGGRLPLFLYISMISLHCLLIHVLVLLNSFIFLVLMSASGGVLGLGFPKSLMTSFVVI